MGPGRTIRGSMATGTVNSDNQSAIAKEDRPDCREAEHTWDGMCQLTEGLALVM